MFGDYSTYILPAYGLSAAVIAALAVWVAAVYRRRLAEIAQLEEMGVSRRSREPADG